MTTYAPESDALPPGRWVPRHGVLRYEVADVAHTPRPMFCGTERGYQWHARHDRANWPLPIDDPCNCRGAHRAYEWFRSYMKRHETGAA